MRVELRSTGRRRDDDAGCIERSALAKNTALVDRFARWRSISTATRFQRRTLLGSARPEPNRRPWRNAVHERLSLMDTILDREIQAAIGPKALWDDLCAQIRDFNPDYVVLVARKMPRLVDAIRLDLGRSAICISDHAVPFVRSQLANSRVAIVDDLWNVGTTMLHVKGRVQRAEPRAVKMFALGAKDAASALAAGVCMAEVTSMGEARYEHFVSMVPNILRSVPKPYDADFPIARYALRAPFGTWEQCWAWLQLEFGAAAHASVDETLSQHPHARATVNLRSAYGWVLKVRLYFDFASGCCNVVPMALAPSLPLEDVYPEGSQAKAVFAAASSTLGPLEKLSPKEDRRDALGRLGAFCDSLVFLDDAVGVLSGLLDRDSEEPFSIKDFAMQFGPTAAQRVRDTFAAGATPVSAEGKERFLKARTKPEQQQVAREPKVIDAAVQKAKEGWPVELVFDALFKGLSKAVGAEKPSDYSLGDPLPGSEVYKRLRIGFTYTELVDFLRVHVRPALVGGMPEAMTSALIDTFVDLGAVVPTITYSDDECLRVYRKGEASPRWDTDLSRLALALSQLKGQEISRTRVSKVAAILALSSAGNNSGLRVSAAERGTVAVMGLSVVEPAVEITTYLLRTGLWGKLVGNDRKKKLVEHASK